MKRERALLRFLRYNGIINSDTNIPLEYYSNEKVENLKFLLTKILKNISAEKLSCDIYDKYIENDDYFIYNFPRKLLPIYSRQLRQIKLKYFHKWQEKNLFMKRRNLKISTNSSSRLYNSQQYHEDYINALKIIDQYKEGINCPFKPKTNQSDLYFINSYRTPCQSHSSSYYNNNFNYNTKSNNFYYNLSSNKNRSTCIKYYTPNKNNQNLENINSNNKIIYKYTEKKPNYFFNGNTNGRQNDIISAISPHYSNFNSNNNYYDTLFSQKQNRASFYSDSNNGSVKRQNRSVKIQYLTSKSINDCNTHENNRNECSIKKHNKIYNIHLADFDPVYEVNVKKSAINKNILRTNSIGLSGAITTNKTNAIFQSETKNNNKKDMLKLDFDSINRYNINSISNSNLNSNKNNINTNKVVNSNKSAKGNDLLISQNYPFQNNENNEVLENRNKKAITVTNGYSCSVLQDKSKDTNTSGMSNFQYCIYPTARESNRTNKYYNYFNKNASSSTQNKLSKNSNKKSTNLELDIQYANDLNPKKFDTSSVCNNCSMKNEAHQIEKSNFTLDPAYKKLTHVTLQTLSDEQILELANHYAEQANDTSEAEK